jgi:hypothetical protein
MPETTIGITTSDRIGTYVMLPVIAVTLAVVLWRANVNKNQWKDQQYDDVVAEAIAQANQRTLKLGDVITLKMPECISGSRCLQGTIMKVPTVANACGLVFIGYKGVRASSTLTVLEGH